MAKLRIPLDFREKDLNRSIYDLSLAKPLTFMQGLDIPLFFEKMMPKDKMNFDFSAMIDSLPMVTRQLCDWKLRFMFFKSSLSNYYGWMDNNARLTSEDFKNRRHHTISARSMAFTEAGSRVLNIMFGRTPTGTSAEYNASLYLQMFASPNQTNGDDELSYEMISQRLGVQPLSVLDMVGFPVGFAQSDNFDDEDYDTLTGNFSADFILCYLDSVRNYLVNNQYDTVPYFVNVPAVAADWTLAKDGKGFLPFEPRIFSVSLKAVDEFFKQLRMQDNGVDIIDLVATMYSVTKTRDLAVELLTWLFSLRWGGCFLAQYEKDMLMTLMQSANAEDISVEVAIDGTTGRFNINELRLRNREQLKADRFSVSGGRWSRLLRSVWGSDTNKNMDIPVLLGAHSFYVSAQSIMSHSDTESADGTTGASLGQLSSVFDTRDMNGAKFVYESDDYAIAFCVASLVPDVVYTQGLGKGLDEIRFDDEYFPQFDAIGFADVPRYKYNALPLYNSSGKLDANNGKNSYLTVVGKNIAWIDLISNVNRAHGKLANDQYFEPWILSRKFENSTTVTGPGGVISDVPIPATAISPYVNPLEYQYVFVAQSSTDQNFVLQVKFDINAVRSKGKYYMPTLGK